MTAAVLAFVAILGAVLLVQFLTRNDPTPCERAREVARSRDLTATEAAKLLTVCDDRSVSGRR